ncbi:SPOR domain-containing protein, partial [Streptomyces cahuitamycinicus]
MSAGGHEQGRDAPGPIPEPAPPAAQHAPPPAVSSLAGASSPGPA